MVRIVEKVALNTPRLVVHLIPLRPRVGIHFHLIQLERAFARLWCRCRTCNEPARTLLVEHLFAVGGNLEGADTAEEWLGLARAQIEFGYANQARLGKSWHVDDLAQKEHAGL